MNYFNLKFLEELCISFSRRDSGLYIYHLFAWSYINCLHYSQWITFPTNSCLILYTFCANLLHLFIILYLIVLSLLKHNQHLYFTRVLSMIALLFSPLEFLTWVLVDGFSMEIEWQQVSSSLQDPSQDSGRSKQCCHLDSICPWANFQVLQAF